MVRFRVNDDFVVENKLITQSDILISKLRCLPTYCNVTGPIVFLLQLQRLKAHTRQNTLTESGDDRNTLPVESFPSLHARQKGEFRATNQQVIIS